MVYLLSLWMPGDSVKQLDSIVKILDSSKNINLCYLIVV